MITAIQFISSIILARLLTPNEIGQFSIGVAMLAIAHMMRDFGIGSYLIQEKDLTQEKIRSALGLTILISWSLASFLYFSKNLIADFYTEKNLSTIMAWMSLNFVIIPFSSPVFALLRREMNFHIIFYINLISSFIAACVAVYFAYKGYSYMSLVWSSITRISSTAILATYFRPKESLVLPSLKNTKEIFSYGGRVSLSNILFTLGTNLSELIIGKYLGFASVAIYSKADTVNNLFSANLLEAIKKVYFPYISENHRKNKMINTLYINAVSYISIITIVFYALLILYAHDIILLLFGDQWIASTNLVKILSIGGIIQSFWNLSPNTLYAIKKPGTVLKIESLIQSLKFGLVLTASFISLEMIAWSLVLSHLISLIIYCIALKNNIQISISKLISRAILPTLIIGSSIALATFTFKSFLKPDSNLILNIVAGGCALMLCWTLSVLTTNHPIKNELKKIKLF